MKKLMIASDIHGCADHCRQLLECFDNEKADRLLLLGDLLYHGPRNGVPESYDPVKVIDLLNARKESLLCVRGNCDSEVDQMVLEFPMMAEYALLNVDDITIYATHGHHNNEQNPPPAAKGSILLCGHTHVPACSMHSDFTYLNPGSVSLPKENSRRGYMLLTDGVFLWKDLYSGEEYRRWSLA